jgi:hypothetical protein
MEFLIILWIFMGVTTGLALGFLEGKVNHRPARYKRALLWTLLAGPVGFCWVGLKSCLDYAGGMREDQRAVADAARATMARNQDPAAGV